MKKVFWAIVGFVAAAFALIPLLLRGQDNKRHKEAEDILDKGKERLNEIDAMDPKEAADALHSELTRDRQHYRPKQKPRRVPAGLRLPED